MLPLSELKTGEKARVRSINDDHLEQKLLEMGCIPGEVIQLDLIAPFGDPVAYSIAGSQLSMRKRDAASIMVEKLL